MRIGALKEGVSGRQTDACLDAVAATGGRRPRAIRRSQRGVTLTISEIVPTKQSSWTTLDEFVFFNRRSSSRGKLFYVQQA